MSHSFTIIFFIRKEGKQCQEGIGNNLLSFVGKREQTTTVGACTITGRRVERPPHRASASCNYRGTNCIILVADEIGTCNSAPNECSYSNREIRSEVYTMLPCLAAIRQHPSSYPRHSRPARECQNLLPNERSCNNREIHSAAHTSLPCSAATRQYPFPHPRHNHPVRECRHPFPIGLRDSCQTSRSAAHTRLPYSAATPQGRQISPIPVIITWCGNVGIYSPLDCAIAAGRTARQHIPYSRTRPPHREVILAVSVIVARDRFIGGKSHGTWV